MTLTWSAASANGGSATGDAPPSPIVTGYRFYYWDGTGSPTSLEHTVGNGWNPVSTVNGGAGSTLSGASNTSCTVTFPDTANNQAIAMALTLDSGFESIFTGPYHSWTAPTPAGVFASADASLKKGQVTVNWRTNVETGTANFQVMASKDGANFSPVEGTMTDPKGNHSFYSVTFPNPYPSAKKFYVKVQSTDFDGKQFSSNTVTIKRKVTVKAGKEVLLDDLETP
jgi:hypothetical protein